MKIVEFFFFPRIYYHLLGFDLTLLWPHSSDQSWFMLCTWVHCEMSKLTKLQGRRGPWLTSSSVHHRPPLGSLLKFSIYSLVTNKHYWIFISSFKQKVEIQWKTKQLKALYSTEQFDRTYSKTFQNQNVAILCIMVWVI